MFKKLLFIASFLLVQPIYGAMTSYPIYNLSDGLYTNRAAEDLPDTYTPDCLNVEFDSGRPRKRRGSIPYLSTALTELQSIRELYQYIQADGDRYMIINSSASMYYSTGDGNTTNIIAGLSTTETDNYVTALDSVYRDNGTDNPGKWNGVTYTTITVLNSTDVPKGRYQAWYKNHLFKAGVDAGRSTLYWSILNNPDDFSSYGSGSKFVGQGDGDVITGLFVYGDRLIITKTYSTWQLVGTDAFTWLVRPLNSNIGCLYQSTMALYKGQYPMWLSHRGVEMFDGVSFTLVSEPIDNLMKSYRQLNVNSSIQTLTSASDWGAGTGVIIDTTTYSGSVAISTTSLITSYNIEQSTSITGATNQNFGTNSKYAQTFYTGLNCLIESVLVNIYTGDSITLKVGIGDSSYNFINSKTTTFSGVTAGYQAFNITKTALTANTTYTLIVEKTDALDANDLIYVSVGSYAKGNLFYYNGAWSSSPTIDMRFYVVGSTATETASYTSSTMTATSWGSWGSFSANETLPSGSAITYGVKTSTANDNFTTRPFIPVSNGGAINSAVGPYIIEIASYTRTDSTAIPMLNEASFQWYQTNSNPPKAVPYNDAYYLGLSTGDNSTTNDVIFKFDKNAKWTVFNNLNMGSACVFRSELYMGSSQNTGMISKLDVPNVYADSGNAYQAYITTKILDLGSPVQEKQYFYRWLNADNSGDWNVYFDYRLNGSKGAWTSDNVSLSDSDNLISKKTNFEGNVRSYYIQLRMGNNTANQYFSLRGLNLIYDVFPLE